MKIVQVAPASPYNEGWGYQENLLTKYQAKAGHDVCLVVTNAAFENGKLTKVEESDMLSNDGFRVVRRKKRKIINNKISEFLSIISVDDILEDVKPDLIFCHGLSNLTIFSLIKYKKRNPSVVIVVDNHADYNIGPNMKGVVGSLSRLFWRLVCSITSRNLTKVYGVTPWRKQFAEEYYGISPNKTDVMIMGADDEKINFSERERLRESIREQYGISANEFLLITGGKIDNKKRVLELIDAVNQIDNVKLMIFGSVDKEVKENFDKYIENNPKVIYIGWIDASRVYDYFFASDLVVFPGQHSVLWEQACAAKVPCVFKHWKGMEHVNNGGNAAFFDDDSVEGMEKKICELVFSDKYNTMKKVAESSATDIFLYSRIAMKSTECVSKEHE